MTLAFAMLLDALLGEPKWLWSRITHPAIVMGRLISWVDQRLNNAGSRRVKGTVAIISLVLFVATLGAVALALIEFTFGEFIASMLEIILVAILLAQRSLVDHVGDVRCALEKSIEAGRLSVGKIVGRDTAQMDRAQVIRATVESAAENLSDAVVAPVFWYLIGGLPALLAYKMINTADSMIGYKNEKYRQFGWAAARIDDLANWVPARITGFLILIFAGRLDQWRAMAQEARKHRSVNAGWPEAAMAYALNIALAGPRHYQGEKHDEPFVHAKGRHAPIVQDITSANLYLWKVWSALFILAIVVEICR